MALKQFNPTSPGRRFMTTLTFDEITKDAAREEPHRAPAAARAAATTAGRITIRFIGGGHKQRYRIIDFRRDKHDVPAKVAAIEYDPNRSARIALLHYADGEKRYILWPEGLKVGPDRGGGRRRRHPARQLPPPEGDPRGHHDPQHRAAPRQGRPDGAQRRRRRPARGQGRATTPRSSCPRARCARSTSTAWPPSARSATSSTRTSPRARPAARAGWAGARTTAGVAMNPVDHPHGGGEGKTSGGRHPVTPWGKPTKGAKTRNNKRTQSFIVKRRK